MQPICSIFDEVCSKYLTSFNTTSKYPKTFEALNQNSGFVLYETTLPEANLDPPMLSVEKIHDRGYIYVNHNFIGILSRENDINFMQIPLGYGYKLRILVENQGRMHNLIHNENKGLIGEVKFDYKQLTNWNSTGYPFNNYSNIKKLIKKFKTQLNFEPTLDKGPVIFKAKFPLTDDQLYDTYLDPTGWGKVSSLNTQLNINNIKRVLFSGFCIHQWI